jgi:hypothetical protein
MTADRGGNSGILFGGHRAPLQNLAELAHIFLD